MKNVDPHPFPPTQRWENGAFWLSRGFVLDLEGWGFTVPFYSVQDGSIYQPEKKGFRYF